MKNFPKFFWKGVFFALTLLFTCSMAMAQDWTAPIEVSGGDTPEMDIDPLTGHVYVLTMNNGVMVTVFDQNGNQLSQEAVDVQGADDDKGLGHWGATIAVDSDGYPHICFRDYRRTDNDGTPLYDAFYVKKTASGWSDRITLAQAVRRGYMVRIDVDENNVAHIVQGFVFDDPGSILGRIYYYRIANNTINKQETLGLNRNRVYRADDRIDIEAYPGGKLHVVSGVPNTGGKEIYHFYSSDGGNNFTNGDGIQASTADGRNGSPDLQIDANGVTHICYGTSEDADIGKEPSVHYAKLEETEKTKDVRATLEGELVDWKIGMGLGSIGCNDNGMNLVIAYTSEPGGPLSATLSTDGGDNWASPVELAEASGSNEGRNKHIVRGNGDNFYLAYPSANKVWLRILSLTSNRPPSADAGGPYLGIEGTPVNFDASNSFDNDGSIVEYKWDWESDGTYDLTTSIPTTQHTYQDDYNGTMKVQVTDNEGATSSDLADVDINNMPPVANANGPYAGEKNTDITLEGSATDPGALDVPILSYVWDLDNDDIYEAIGQFVVARYNTGGDHIVKLKVADDDGGVDIDTTYVSIPNLPPSVITIPDQSITKGETFAPIQLDFFVQDPDNADDEISWEITGGVNILFDIFDRTAFPQIVNPDWTGTETITFTARDPGNLADSTSARFTVLDAINPPSLSNIPSQTKDEGTAFDAIQLDDYVYDPDNDKSELMWKVEGNVELSLNWIGHTLNIVVPDPDWFGSETLTFIVTDPDQLSDTTSATYTMTNVNDAPVISGLVGESIAAGQQFAPIQLDEKVADVDHADAQLTWTYSGNTDLIINISASRVATISTPAPNWVGSENITFEVSDGELSDDATVTFSVSEINLPPVISTIPSQTIGENQSFQSIYLDGFVTDPNNTDDEISWFISGFQDLVVQWQDRTVTVAVPDSEWAGTETLTFIARDPGGLADTAAADFRVVPINDPPLLSPLQDYTMQEDDTLKLNLTMLKSMVSDPDNGPDDFTFEIYNNVNLNWMSDASSGLLKIFSREPDWFGSETVLLAVYDGAGGFDEQPVLITVRPVPDPPVDFSVISPNNSVFTSIPGQIIFLWHGSYDPDNGNPVTYELSLSQSSDFHHVFDSFLNLSDTTFTYRPSPPLYDGDYFWRVKATTVTGLYEYSNTGTFSINRTAVEDGPENGIPEIFALEQNYPNPFNPETQIRYQLPEDAHVRIDIYNAVGQLVRQLMSSEQRAGVHHITWDGLDDRGASPGSGVYICRFQAQDHVSSRKMILLQ
ncbi:MAG: PKD domain-containing protein [candidate division KSB1 bacterium]|jgi:hypothetical protein|nr:PKD domain-containing protein [candidate division KSB1 bacterium]